MNEPNNNSGTPLIMTALAQSARLMKILLVHKADVSNF
jgi:hypothetical protein